MWYTRKSEERLWELARSQSPPARHALRRGHTERLCITSAPDLGLWACNAGQWGKPCWGPAECSCSWWGSCRQSSGRLHSPVEIRKRLRLCRTQIWCEYMLHEGEVGACWTYPISSINLQSLAYDTEHTISWLRRRGVWRTHFNCCTTAHVALHFRHQASWPVHRCTCACAC